MRNAYGMFLKVKDAESLRNILRGKGAEYAQHTSLAVKKESLQSCVSVKLFQTDLLAF